MTDTIIDWHIPETQGPPPSLWWSTTVSVCDIFPSKHRETDTQRETEWEMEGEWVNECNNTSVYQLMRSSPPRVPQNQIHARHKTNLPAWNKWKTWSKSVWVNKHFCNFPLEAHSLSIEAAFATRHIVWQTHGFVVWKMSFQRVVINNSLMTNGSDIYTALGVGLELMGRQ